MTSETIASAETITPADGVALANITGATEIKTITPRSDPRPLTLKFAGSLTVANGSNQKLGANFAATPDDTLTLICDGTYWYRVASAAN